MGKTNKLSKREKINNLSIEAKAKLVKKKDYYLVYSSYFSKKEIVTGYYNWVTPFGNNDNLVYVLNGQAVGIEEAQEIIAKGWIKKITKAEAIRTLLASI